MVYPPPKALSSERVGPALTHGACVHGRAAGGLAGPRGGGEARTGGNRHVRRLTRRRLVCAGAVAPAPVASSSGPGAAAFGYPVKDHPGPAPAGRPPPPRPAPQSTPHRRPTTRSRSSQNVFRVAGHAGVSPWPRREIASAAVAGSSPEGRPSHVRRGKSAPRRQGLPAGRSVVPRPRGSPRALGVQAVFRIRMGNSAR